MPQALAPRLHTDLRPQTVCMGLHRGSASMALIFISSPSLAAFIKFRQKIFHVFCKQSVLILAARDAALILRVIFCETMLSVSASPLKIPITSSALAHVMTCPRFGTVASRVGCCKLRPHGGDGLAHGVFKSNQISLRLYTLPLAAFPTALNSAEPPHASRSVKFHGWGSWSHRCTRTGFSSLTT